MVEHKVVPDAALTGMTASRDGLREEVYRRSRNHIILSVELIATRRSMSAARTEDGTVGGQCSEQKRLKEEPAQRMTDVQYELDSARAKKTRSSRFVNVVYRRLLTVF